MWYKHVIEYYSVFRKEILSHATTWMNLEDIKLRNQSQLQKKQILYDSTYMRSLQ